MKNILVFPCGSEIGLEIHRALRYSAHFRLIGASSVSDHGRFVYENYRDGLPLHDAPEFVSELGKLVEQANVDAIYPAMDLVAQTIKSNEALLGCKIIGSSTQTTAMCASKKRTYAALKGVVPIPRWEGQLERLQTYPIFIKPDVGYGSRNVTVVQDLPAAQQFVNARGGARKFVFCDYLPGREFTIDCFSDRHGELLFHGARERVRISNGISVNTRQARNHLAAFDEYARKINEVIKPRGAWFFQMKEDRDGNPNLLEVAARLGGSSALFRSLGVNFALLSAFDAFDMNVSIAANDYQPELDRALSNRFRLNIEYSTIYVDYDDCLLLGDVLNYELLGFIFKSINEKKKVILISRHAGNLSESLRKHRISALFDEVIHLRKEEKKSAFMMPDGAIFIDDSHTERLEVKNFHRIPVFSPDMIEALI